MIKEKVAFVVIRYGKNVNGGAEQHCRMLAERLTLDYDVEILTTCVEDYVSGENSLPAGEERIDNILVHRFPVEPVHPELHSIFEKKAKTSRRIRKHLYQLGLLKWISSLFPIWKFGQDVEDKLMQSHVLYSPKLISFIKENKQQYRAIIPLTMVYPPVYYAALYAPEKTILIPTMHLESSSFRSIQTNIFTKVAYVGFNTNAEQKLAESIFGIRMSRHGIISVGIEDSEDADWTSTKEKYSLPDNYILFVGRIDSGKLHHIVDYFLEYKKIYANSDLKLVLVGGLYSKPLKHPDVLYTGFVSDGEKYAIIQHAKIFVNPSKFESLSLILLEGFSRGKAMLVNGKCAVLKEHCKLSGGAAMYYVGKKDFITKLHKMEESEELRRQMGEKGKSYVTDNYGWGAIMDRLKLVVKSI